MKQKNSMDLPRVLTVAGSDSGGGAGIQADLKTIALLGGYGMSAVTALTAQNTRGVQSVQEIPAAFVEEQLEAVLSDLGTDAIKTGMLGTGAIVHIVSRKIRQYGLSCVVVDPVLSAKGGQRLLSPDGVEILRRELLPLAQVITPNLPESEALTGKRVRTLKGMREAAVQMNRMGAKNILIKGGHLPGEPVDLFFDGREFYELKGKRFPTPHTHGTGCTLAAALAVEMARGETPLRAVEKARRLIASAIEFSLPLGRGHGPVNPYAAVAREGESYRILQSLKEAFAILREKPAGPLIPEVQSNLGFALPWARRTEDVAAFPGRLVRLGAEIIKLAEPEFGASRHIAKIILTTMAHDPAFRSAMNLRFSEELLRRARKAGFLISHFDRADEPRRIKRQEGSSLSWGVERVLRRARRTPDLIFDRGGVGKEPMIRILGRSPEEVVRKVLRLV